MSRSVTTRRTACTRRRWRPQAETRCWSAGSGRRRATTTPCCSSRAATTSGRARRSTGSRSRSACSPPRESSYEAPASAVGRPPGVTARALPHSSCGKRLMTLRWPSTQLQGFLFVSAKRPTSLLEHFLLSSASLRHSPSPVWGLWESPSRGWRDPSITIRDQTGSFFYSREVGWKDLGTNGPRMRARSSFDLLLHANRGTTGRLPPAHDPKGGSPDLRDPS